MKTLPDDNKLLLPRVKHEQIRTELLYNETGGLYSKQKDVTSLMSESKGTCLIGP